VSCLSVASRLACRYTALWTCSAPSRPGGPRRKDTHGRLPLISCPCKKTATCGANASASANGHESASGTLVTSAGGRLLACDTHGSRRHKHCGQVGAVRVITNRANKRLLVKRGLRRARTTCLDPGSPCCYCPWAAGRSSASTGHCWASGHACCAPESGCVHATSP
jgi:hypothetical protein